MKELATALVKAQARIDGAKKDSTNPHFKNKYADLGAVWDACREALHSNGLGIVQTPCLIEGQWALATTLVHESGEQISGYVPLLNTKGDMQGLGSAITYARRYGLAAIVGVCPEDDDGNAASGKTTPPQHSAPVAAPDGYAQFIADLRAAAKKGTAALKTEWLESPTELRAHMTLVDAKGWEALKDDAAKVTA
jgi:hypothetical protein